MIACVLDVDEAKFSSDYQTFDFRFSTLTFNSACTSLRQAGQASFNLSTFLVILPEKGSLTRQATSDFGLRASDFRLST